MILEKDCHATERKRMVVRQKGKGLSCDKKEKDCHATKKEKDCHATKKVKDCHATSRTKHNFSNGWFLFYLQK